MSQSTSSASERPWRILVADNLADEGLRFIAGQPDVELRHQPGLSEAELAAAVRDCDGMIVRSGVQVTAAVLADPGRLQVVARAGVGVDNIDLDAATARGILVLNSAEASTTSTAEHALALLLGLARQLGPASRTMTEGGWDRSRFVGSQLAGKTLGVIGFGRIGQTVAKRALAFEMKVVAYDPFINATTGLDGQVKLYHDFATLLPDVDLMTFHVPLNESTRGMLGAATFPLCRRGVLIVNASRGGIVDEAALLSALQSGQCGGAALDVYTVEPLPPDSPLRQQPQLLLTPHLGAATHEAQEAVSVSAARSLLSWLRGGGLSGAVNAGDLRADLDPLQRGFCDLAGRMGLLLQPMLSEGIGEVHIELSGEQPVAAADNIDRAALVALLQPHLDGLVNLINVRHLADQRGIAMHTASRPEKETDGPILVLRVYGQPRADGSRLERVIVGRIYHDMMPRIVEINGYRMDMIPAGTMVLIQNDDRPGMVGLVGAQFGDAGVNIADMAISRRDQTALMVLKVDDEPQPALLDQLRACCGIRKAAMVRLSPAPILR